MTFPSDAYIRICYARKSFKSEKKTKVREKCEKLMSRQCWTVDMELLKTHDDTEDLGDIRRDVNFGK